MRASGILMPIFSLPSQYGIGTFSKEAIKFIDLLAAAGQSFWQVLPLGPTSYGDSPYQSFSSFAMNPYFIDLDELYKEKLLKEEELPPAQQEGRYIDYGHLFKTRYQLLRRAYQRFDLNNASFEQFKKENREWLSDYSSFMAIKNHFDNKDIYQWDVKVLTRDPQVLERLLGTCKEDVGFYEFLQYKGMEQWERVHQYANSKGIQIIGDIPIYVALDSAECWNSPELFRFDKGMKPIAVAGCPPDSFALTGQLWGNPLYNWEYHKETGYEWWIKRILHSFKLFDVVRIDHFRGFDEYYSIPYGDKTAEHGTWEKGPGINLFECLNAKLGKVQIIAEDLGFMTDGVIRLLKDSGYPGMKVLQFAFDSREESDYIPHTYTKNSVVYTGTHDNDTLMGWLGALNKEDREYAMEYLGVHKEYAEINWDFIRLAMASVADMAIIPIQDYLGLGSEARINTPSTLGNNWRWRMLPGELKQESIEKIARMTKVYGRANKVDKAAGNGGKNV